MRNGDSPMFFANAQSVTNSAKERQCGLAIGATSPASGKIDRYPARFVALESPAKRSSSD
jgi:hypothetical protein